MTDTINEMIAVHKKLIEKFESEAPAVLKQMAEMILDTYSKGGCVYLCGNGGSAADCQHIAGELVGRLRTDRAPLAAVALSADTSTLTCIGNDYGFNDIFSRQVTALMGKNDLLWAFSTSGASKNIIAAANEAKNNGSKVIAFTGKADSSLEKISDVCLACNAEFSDNAQQIHQLAYHIICNLVEKNITEK